MTENRIPTEQELDALLDRQPPFNLEAVKVRTLSRIGEQAGQPVKRRTPLRCFLIAAVICALSVSAVTAADYVTAGRLSAALGIRKPAEEQVSEPAPPPEAETPPVHTEKPAPAPEPEPAPEPPELDAQIAGALQVSQGQAQRLRPAVQAVEQTAEDQDVRMTVLQTLGDPACLYIKLRFDFPEEVPASEYLEFDTFNVSFDGADGYSWSEKVLERTDRSIIYLLTVKLYGQEDLNGQTVTVTEAEVYPTHVRVNVADDPANTAWLKGLEFYLENEDGERFEPISNGVTASGDPDSPANVSFRPESPYFADSEHLTLHITGAEWLDKDMERVRVNLADRTAERLPEGVTFRSAEKRDGGWVLSFRVKKREENHTHQVWYSTFYDEAGNQYEANRRGTTTDDSGCFEEMMPLPGYQENVVWLQPTYSRTTTEITPVTIPIK